MLEIHTKQLPPDIVVLEVVGRNHDRPGASVDKIVDWKPTVSEAAVGF